MLKRGRAGKLGGSQEKPRGKLSSGDSGVNPQLVVPQGAPAPPGNPGSPQAASRRGPASFPFRRAGSLRLHQKPRREPALPPAKAGLPGAGVLFLTVMETYIAI